MEKNETVCECGNTMVGINLYGKICPKCHSYISTEFELKVIKENRLKNEIDKQEALDRLKNRIKGDLNGY